MKIERKKKLWNKKCQNSSLMLANTCWILQRNAHAGIDFMSSGNFLKPSYSLASTISPVSIKRMRTVFFWKKKKQNFQGNSIRKMFLSVSFPLQTVLSNTNFPRCTFMSILIPNISFKPSDSFVSSSCTDEYFQNCFSWPKCFLWIVFLFSKSQILLIYMRNVQLTL